MVVDISKKTLIEEPLVSIAMTTYNGEKFLLEQLDSLRDQDYGNFEIIVCDDRSSDSTFSMLESYRDQYPSLEIAVYQNEKNLGYVANFQKAVGYCKGQYIAFCDQDDIWEVFKISKLVAKMIEKNDLAVFSDAILIDANAKEYDLTLWQAVLGTSPPEVIHFQAFYLSNCVTGCTMLIDKDLLELGLPFVNGIPHDWWLAYHAAYAGRLSFVADKLVRYRQHDSNVYGVGAVLRRKSLSLYLRHKIQKWQLADKVIDRIRSAELVRLRLDAMSRFESKANNSPSDALLLLSNWVQARLLGQDVSQYEIFFQTDDPAFQLYRPSKNSYRNIDFDIRRDVSRFCKRQLVGAGYIGTFIIIIFLFFN
jgi:glycosyltransferase involved in cell wall biosynthesis